MSSDKPKTTVGTGKKVFDVAKPGKSVPSSSAKPIIITNRPVLKDPMVTPEAPAATPTTEVPAPSKPRTKITISPINEELESSVKSLTDAKPEPEAAPAEDKGSTIIAVQSEEPEPETPTEEPKPETPAEAPVEAAEPKTTPEPEEDKSVTEPEPPQEPAATEAESSKESKKEGTTEAATGDAQKTADKEAEEAARLELERQAELQKIIESKQYALPINTMEKRRNKRDILLGALFILLLAVVWFDIALDAGMLHIQGIHAYTHFFNK